MNIMRIRLGVLLLTLGTMGGCATPGLTPSESVTTLVQGWEHYFRIETTATPTPQGTLLDGYIYNQYGRPMRVRLLGQALDASGQVLAQRIEWVPGTVPTLHRSYFRISPLPPADQYRVTVWSFDIIDSDDFFRRF
jgi:hypothetical protein